MNLGKRISAWWNNSLCWLFGHSRTTVCTRCGKLVDLEGTERPTLEDRINGYFRNRKTNKERINDPKFKGSLKLTAGLKKYSINLLTNELRLVEYDEDKEMVLDFEGNPKVDKNNSVIYKTTARKAAHNPSCVYIDAANDENAIRKANNYIRGIKSGVRITEVTINN